MSKAATALIAISVLMISVVIGVATRDHAPPEKNVSAITPKAESSATPESTPPRLEIETQPEPQTAPSATPAPVDDPRVQALTAERNRTVLTLKAAEAMLRSPGIATRAKIFCRSMKPATPMWSAGTLEELEISYSQLMQAEPMIGEEEMKRQQRLDAVRQVLTIAYQNLNQCIGMHSVYGQPLPTDADEREEAAQARTRIAEIDQEIAAGR